MTAPAFTLQPRADQTVPYRGSVTLSADVSGFPVPLLQWYYGTSGDTSWPISDANWKTCTVFSLAASTSFWVRATNPQGSADSATAYVSVMPSPMGQWRLTHFGTVDNTGDAADYSDPDGDGITNLEEFTAGTVPTDGADQFQIISAVRSAEGFTVTVAGKAGRRYQLERHAQLLIPNGIIITATPAPLTADGPVTLTDPAPPAPPATRAFYRVSVSLP